MKSIVLVLFAIACSAPSPHPAAPLQGEAPVATSSPPPPPEDAAVVAPSRPDAPSGLAIGSLPLVGDAPAGVGIERVVEGWVAMGWPDREGLAVQRVDAASNWSSKAAALAMAKKQQYEVPIVEELPDGLALSYRVTAGGQSMYSLIAYRRIGAETYFCAGGSSHEARRDEMLAFCKSLRPR